MRIRWNAGGALHIEATQPLRWLQTVTSAQAIRFDPLYGSEEKEGSSKVAECPHFVLMNN
jgi:hypothetical protein